MNICVTGGAGFVGTHLVEELKRRGYNDIFIPRSVAYDLRKEGDVKAMLSENRPDIVIHLAGVVGGIGANRRFPATFFYDNAIMGIQLIELSRKFEVKKFVQIASVCAYPKHTPVPFKETDLWKGYPEETNAPYGLAKKMLLVQLQAYRQQYGFNGVFVLPTNMFGPRDNFDLESSHVIPALIRKCVEAKEEGRDEIVVWGTGRASRDFLYVEDGARCIADVMEKYDDPDPINLGSGVEIAIRDLVHLIAEAVGFEGKIKYDTSKPDGQPRRRLDVTRARQKLGWEPKISIADGLKKTVDWYLRNRAGKVL